MKIKLLLITLLAFFLITTSCSKDENQTQAPDTGTITGRLLVLNGSKPVGGALVFVLDNDNKLHYTYTEANGDYTLEAPVGNQTLQMQTGNGSNFRTAIPVTVVKNQTISIENSISKLNQVANMAYVAGTYDKIEDIVTALGYTITQITNADLADYATVSQYDVIFLNCGAKQSGSNSDLIDANLAQFVTNGGSLYASDWAVAYLTGGLTHSINCGESGGFIPDSKLCAKSNGSATTISGAQVSNSSLATALGFSALDIQFDLPSWETVFSYDAAYWDVLVQDPISNNPLMIKTNQFSSGSCTDHVGRDEDDNGWVTICHRLGNGGSITITINDNALPAHIAHGDSMGACDNTTNSGTIYYTTFHNHASGNIGNSGLILEYVILNL